MEYRLSPIREEYFRLRPGETLEKDADKIMARYLQGYNHLEQEEEYDEEPEEKDHCSCGRVCMSCLGMSWRDFI
jgi:hypothetical protein